MPAVVSSPIPVIASYATRPEAAGAGPGEDLLAALGRVPDPRRARGVRYRLVTLLGIAVCAVLAGATSWAAIAEWGRDLPLTARVRLGIGRRAPSESALRRVLQRIDPQALDAVLSGWLSGCRGG